MDEFTNTNPLRDKIASFALIIYLMIFIAMGFYGLSAEMGFTEQIDTTRFWTFGLLIVLFIIVLILKIGLWTFLKETPFARYIYLPIHDPELGFFKNINVLSNPLFLFMISVLLFTFLGFIGSALPESSAYIFPLSAGQVEQQTTPAGKFLFGFFNAPAENVFLYITIFTGMSIGLYFLRKYNIKLAASLILLMVIFAPLGGFIWGKIHVGVSGSDEEKTLGNTLFGANNVILIIATGSIIPTEVYHVTNNVFTRSKELWDNDITVVIFIVLFILEIIVFSLAYTYGKRLTVLMQKGE